MQDETSRRLTAILAADVVGFSRLVADDEEGTLARLQSVRAAFGELIARYRGRIFNTAGDAIRAEFQSAGDAVRCAEALQARAEELASGQPDTHRIRFRIGVALGDVVDAGGDLLGDGVSLAETLEAAAPVGGVCISRSVHDAVVGKTKTAFLPATDVIRDGAAVPAYVAHLAAGGAERSPPMGQVSEIAKVSGMRDNNDGRRAAAGKRSGWVWLAGLGALTFLAVFAGQRLMQGTPPQKVATPSPPKSQKAPEAPASAKTAPVAPTPAPSAPKPSPAPARPANTDGASSPASPTPAQPTPAAPSSAATAPAATAPAATAPARPADDHLRTDAATQAFARQWQDCAKGKGETQIAACKGLLDSPGTLSDADLGTLNHHLGRARLEKGEIEPAITALTTSVDKAPTADAYVARGIAYHQKGDLEAAVRDFTEAIKREPKNGEALNNRAWSRYKLKQNKAALDDADEATKLIGDKGYAWDTRGHINEALGNKAAAIADYKKAIELDANASESREALKRLGASP